ncbi:hypothetical protein A6J60_011495 [Psychrobacter sp. FDAARGOS_221]|nr:hypothetical protein A6J60_011495 [Psychrobacter sp. FDAARGOS_221]
MALAVVLAVLQLSPEQLTVISLGVSAERWQLSAYLFMASWCLLWLLPYGYRLFFSPSGLASSSEVSASNQPLHHTQPLKKFSSQLASFLHTSQPIYALMMMSVFWLAIMMNSVAQRMVAIEQSVPRVISVEANVTPLGVSDRRLAFESDQQQVLKQGYRQLVTLHDIKPYTRQNNSALATQAEQNITTNTSQANTETNKTKSGTPAKQQLQHNPLSVDTSQLEHTLSITASTATNHSTNDQLPTTMTVMLSGYKPPLMALNDFAPDEQLRMQLQLSPIELLEDDSEGEFDEYRWLSSRHATAKAKVLSAEFDSKQKQQSTLRLWIDSKRFGLREHFIKLTENQQQVSSNDQLQHRTIPTTADAIAVTLSLLTGDRSLISNQITELYRFAGISHLLAISGTHVLFLAMLCAGLVTGLLTHFAPGFYRVVPRWQCAFVISVIAAFGYALFAGFDVPALRTACMLLVVGVLRYVLASASIFKVLLVLAVAMVWADIFVLWQAGFWLSFIAVAVLVIYSQRWEKDERLRPQQQQSDNVDSSKLSQVWQGIKQAVWGVFKLQLWMSLALLPISLWLFGQVSLWGFVVNLFAIGLFGWVIVPINLLAGVLHAALPNYPHISDSLWSGLFWLLQQLHSGLFALQSTWQQTGWIYASPSLVLLLLITLAAIPWILPKGILSRLLSLPPLLVIATMAIYQMQQQQNLLHIQVLTPPKQVKSAPLSATLIWHQQQSWLLLSAYPQTGYAKAKSNNNTKQGSFNTKPQALWDLQQQQQLTQSLYDQIKQQQIGHLTGVIVQTATPQLVTMVAQLRQMLPISYYWQAGLSANSSYVESKLASSGMTAQGCHVGLSWQSNIDHDYSSDSAKPREAQTKQGFMITAVTGWDEVQSESVWGCAIDLTTDAALDLPKSVRLATIDAAEAVNSGVAKAGQPQQFLFYSSAKPALGQLWNLMCEGDADIANKQTARHHWLSTSQASIDKQLVSNRQPLSWHILDESILPATLKQKQTHLYWQQQPLSVK